MKRINISLLVLVSILSACSANTDIPSTEYVQTVIAQTIAANPTVTDTAQALPVDVPSATSAVLALPTRPAPPKATITPTFLPATGTAQVLLATSEAVLATQTAFIGNQRATQVERRTQLTATLIAMAMDATDRADALTATQIAKVKGSTATQAVRYIFATEAPQYKEMSWLELKSYPEKFLGQKITLQGNIVEIDAPDNFLKLEIDGYDWVDITMREPIENVYIGNTIRVYGIWCGSGILRITWCMNGAFYRVK